MDAGAGDLVERGRGLAVVASLCRGAFEIGWEGKRRVSRWEVTGYVCEKSEPSNVGDGRGDAGAGQGRQGWHREFYAELREAFLAAGPPTYARLVVIMRRLQHRIALTPCQAS